MSGAALANGGEDTTPDPASVGQEVRKLREEEWGKAALRATAALRTEVTSQYGALAASMQTLHDQAQEDRRANARRHAQLTEGQSVILQRLDSKDMNDQALQEAVTAVHRAAFTAKDEVAALGAQVGTTTAALAQEDAAHRGALLSLHEHEKAQDEAIKKTADIALRARVAAGIRIGALLVAGAGLFKLAEFLYPLIHH